MLCWIWTYRTWTCLQHTDLRLGRSPGVLTSNSGRAGPGGSVAATSICDGGGVPASGCGTDDGDAAAVAGRSGEGSVTAADGEAESGVAAADSGTNGGTITGLMILTIFRGPEVSEGPCSASGEEPGENVLLLRA